MNERQLTEDEMKSFVCRNDQCSFRFACLYNRREGKHPKWLQPVVLVEDHRHWCESYEELDQ